MPKETLTFEVFKNKIKEVKKSKEFSTRLHLSPQGLFTGTRTTDLDVSARRRIPLSYTISSTVNSIVDRRIIRLSMAMIIFSLPLETHSQSDDSAPTGHRSHGILDPFDTLIPS